MHLSPAAAKSLAKWHEMLARRNLTDLGTIVAESAIFRSPLTYPAQVGHAVVCETLRAAYAVLEDLAYHREFTNRYDAVLEFSAHVRGKRLKGVDIIHFNEAGMIAEIEVMVRPGTGLAALAEAMQEKLGPVEASQMKKGA